MEEKSYLELLVGKSITKTSIGTSSTIGIKENSHQLIQERFNVFWQIFIEDFLLNINNPITILPIGKSLDDLIGRTIIQVSETTEDAHIFFDDNSELTINLRDEVYWDPEAMILYGPNNFWVVWN